MSQKSIREVHGKQMMQRWFATHCSDLPMPQNIVEVRFAFSSVVPTPRGFLNGGHVRFFDRCHRPLA
jgi:hypothetical protein